MIALDQLNQNEKHGKINPKPLKALFKVVIDDILYEISCVMNYTDYLQSQIKRLETIEKYDKKRLKTDNQSKKEYYLTGMKMLLQNGESIDTYKDIWVQYQQSLVVRKQRINDLHKEIKIIKKLKI